MRAERNQGSCVANRCLLPHSSPDTQMDHLLQEERLNRLKHLMNVYFDPSRHGHQEALRALCASTHPDQGIHGLISEQWKQMGWQGKDPSTDFRHEAIKWPHTRCSSAYYRTGAAAPNKANNPH